MTLPRTYRTLSLSLPPEAVAILEQRAKPQGKTAARLAAELVLATLHPTPAEQRLADARAHLDTLAADLDKLEAILGP